MKSIKKIFLVGLACVSIFLSLQASDKPWHPGQTYIIPDDGYTYTLDWSYSLTDDLLISGTLKILATTVQNVALANDGYQITIESDGVLTLTAGWGTNGQDYDSGGADGVAGKDVLLTNNGTITVDGIIIATGGDGGNGGDGAGGTGNSGGNGGRGGSATLDGNGTISVSEGGILNLIGGTGGNGGNGGPSGTGNSGGNGGVGGSATNTTITIKTETSINLNAGSGGNGGNGGGSEDDADYNRGGTGGNGGDSVITILNANININSGTNINLHGGNGGTGGNGGGSGSDADYNNGGAGGNAGGTGIGVLYATMTIENGGSVNLNGGAGGKGSTTVIGASNATITVSNRGSITLNGGTVGSRGVDGGNVSLGGAGGDGSVAELEAYDTNIVTEEGGIITLNGGSTGDFARISGNITTIEGTCKDQSLFSCDPSLTLTQQLDIDFTWTITCNKTIWGNGYSIVLGPNGEIVIDDGVTLHLDNLDVEGVDNNNIRCIDDDSILELKNVNWNQDANYTFTKGEIKIYGSCVIDGAGKTFKLEDIAQLTIKSNATLKLMPNTTLEYDTNQNNLFVMTDDTSTFHLNNARLLATQNLILQTGVLITDKLGILEGNPGMLSIGGLSNIIVGGGLAKVGSVVW